MRLQGTIDVYRMTDAAMVGAEQIGEEYDIEIRSVTAVIGNWRKANAIHRWFVENVQEGNDTGGDYQVTHSQLSRLLDTVNDVLDHPEKAADWLPAMDGFYYGSIAYDDDYFRSLKDTQRVLHKALSEEMADWEYTYSSSW